jgi:hypothetical protein
MFHNLLVEPVRFGPNGVLDAGINPELSITILIGVRRFRRALPFSAAVRPDWKCGLGSMLRRSLSHLTVAVNECVCEGSDCREGCHRSVKSSRMDDGVKWGQRNDGWIRESSVREERR